MKKILLLTDFSENSWNAIAYTIAFFHKEPIHYVLGHIARPNHSFHFLEISQPNSKKDVLITSLEKLERIKNKMLLHEHLNENQIEIAYREESFTKGIKNIIEEYKVDLIVMGSKGISQIENTAIGSHTFSVITKVKHPLLIIPEATVFKKPLNIAFTIDYNFTFKSKVLSTLSNIVTAYNSELSVLRVLNNKLHLSPFQQTNRTYLKDYFKNTSVGFYKIDQSELETGIQNFIDTMEIDMIAMIAINLNFFQKLFFKKKEIKMNYHLNTPFLVLHE